MTALVLMLLAGIVFALLGMSVLAAVLRPGLTRWVLPAVGGLCAVAAIADLAFLAVGGGPAGIAVPLGLPGVPMVLALDALSGVFLLLLFVTAGACAVYAMDAHGIEVEKSLPFFPSFIAAMALALLAGDGFTLLLGFEAMSLASWAAILVRHEEAASRDAALLYIGMAAFSAACLLPALVLLSPSATSAGGLGFAAMREAAAPEGWRGLVVLVLVLLGAGSKAGLAPLHVWLPLAHPAAPSHFSALMSGAMTKVALYVLIRVLFDLYNAPPPLWWGVPVMAMGAASAVLGGLRANMETDVKAVLAASTIENVGLIAIGIGIALTARGADLPGLAALALAGALLHAVNHGVFKTLLFLGVGAAAHGAGSRALSRLGGLIHRMPVTTACMLLGSLGLAALPPGSGFASEWLLFQSVLAAPRIGGLGLQILFAVIAALTAMAAALAAAAVVRLVGVAFLGRPRTPRGAAAHEAGRPALAAMLGLSGISVALGLLPGPMLWLIDPALKALTGSDMAERAGMARVMPTADWPGYAAPAVAVLLGLAFFAAAFFLRHFAVRGHRNGPAWASGFAAAPAWLPFGDPMTQYGGDSFAQPIRRALGSAMLAAREDIDPTAPGETRAASLTIHLTDPAGRYLFAPVVRLRNAISLRADAMTFLSIRATLGVMFTVLVLLLAVIAWVEAS